MNTSAPPRTAACIILSMLALMATTPGRSAEPARSFDIPAGAAAARLNQWAEQAGIGLIGDFEKISGLSTRAVKGSYTPQAALRVMTRETRISCRYTRPRVMWCSLAPQAPREPARKPPAAAAAASSPEQMVVVTGSHIRGVSPTGARNMSFSREELAATGLGTVADIVRTLPQNFDGGPTEDTFLIGRETRTNVGRGTALNLRGLGPAETLVLLNGRRLAPGGSEGAFTDVSSIPLIAVERIDILPDSGSALYGSDAIGGVVNVIFDRDGEGFETQARSGLATQHGPGEFRIGQRFGYRSAEGGALAAVEYYGRDNLPASRRARAHSDLRRFGGSNFDLVYSNPGTLVTGSGVWGIPAGQDGSSLQPGDLIAGVPNLSDRMQGADVIARQRRLSALGSWQRSISTTLELHADALISRREADQHTAGVRANLPVTALNPFYVNPTGGSEPVFVAYDLTKDLGRGETHVSVTTSNLSLGGSLDMSHDWRLAAYAARAREDAASVSRNLVSYRELLLALQDPDPATAFNPFGDGSHTAAATLARIRSSGHFTARSTLDSLNATADGPLLQLPGGTMKLALGAEYRHQALDSGLSSLDIVRSETSLSRDVNAAYAELLVPLAQAGQQLPGLRELTLSLATRYEDHAGISRTSAPKTGLTWSPLKGFIVRGTWTAAFRAPNLADLYEGQNTSAIGVLPDPASPTGASRILVWGDKNADLRPESSRGWTLGAELSPGWLAGWSVAATYFNIGLRNQFSDYRFGLDALLDPASASRVIRSPNASERAAVCARSTFVGPPGACLGTPIDAIIDARVLNSAYLATSGVDVGLKRTFEGRAGRFGLDVNGAYVLRYASRESATARLIERVDTQNNVLRLRLRSSLAWERGSNGAKTFVNFDGDYRDVASQPQRRVGSWTTWDLEAHHDFARRERGAMADCRLALSVQNLFDSDPPFLNNALGLGYDAENADLLGRVVSVQVTTRW